MHASFRTRGRARGGRSKNGRSRALTRPPRRSSHKNNQAAVKPPTALEPPSSRCTEDIASRPEWIDVGYHLLPDARGCGYATEAARALLGYGFKTLKLSEIYAVVSPHNAPSQAVMQRLGMPRTGQHQHIGIEVISDEAR